MIALEGMRTISTSLVCFRTRKLNLLSKRFILIGFLAAVSISVSVVTISLFKKNIGLPYSVKTNIFSFYDGDEGFQWWNQPPRSLLHRMSDRELFWSASLVPKIKEYPFNRTSKIAFMFLTLGPLPLAPVWERFFKGHERWYSIYVHSLPSFQPKFRSSSVFYKRNVPSQTTEWGTMSLVDAERRLLANALLDISNERFVLLSESCIPLYNFTYIYNYIMNSKTSFVDAFDDPGPYGRGRYNPKMAPLVNLTDWRKGNQWFEVDRRLAIALVVDTKFHPLFQNYCKPHCYVDEHYFPTFLTIEAPSRIANRSLTLVDWSRGGAHPATFGRADISADFFYRLKHKNFSCNYNNQSTDVCFLFARKFAPNSLEPLLKLPVL